MRLAALVLIAVLLSTPAVSYAAVTSHGSALEVVATRPEVLRAYQPDRVWGWASAFFSHSHRTFIKVWVERRRASGSWQVVSGSLVTTYAPHTTFIGSGTQSPGPVYSCSFFYRTVVSVWQEGATGAHNRARDVSPNLQESC